MRSMTAAFSSLFMVRSLSLEMRNARTRRASKSSRRAAGFEAPPAPDLRIAGGLGQCALERGYAATGVLLDDVAGLRRVDLDAGPHRRRRA